MEQVKDMDQLALEAGGYVQAMTEEELEYTNLFFDICKQFGIHYASADKKEKYFIDEVTRVTWARMQEKKSGEKKDIRLAFTA